MSDKIKLRFRTAELSADIITPVGVYLRLRDSYPCSLLLECTDYSSRTNAYSYICLNPIAGISVTEKCIRTYLPDGSDINYPLNNVIEKVNDFTSSIDISGEKDSIPESTGFYGFTSFDSAFLFNKFEKKYLKKVLEKRELPFLKYDFYKVILTINHFNDTLFITEYYNDEIPYGETNKIISLLSNHNIATYPFSLEGTEESLTTDSDYKEMVREAIKNCSLGNVFQLVVSRRFRQKFTGDEFNVYRSLRSVNPSPYLFYFDYIEYKIFGSSPEAQLKVEDGRAIINPIAGTIRKTGDPEADRIAALSLQEDPKENSEHVMLVDLARNDLSRNCTDVSVDIYREVQTFSHLMHLVSTVSGTIKNETTAFSVFAATFPAGTLSGAPKYKALQLINKMETIARGYYGGAVGVLGTNGSINHAITIRSFLSRNGYLNFQAGAGIVINSTEEGELNEVNNKLDALRTAMRKANSNDKK